MRRIFVERANERLAQIARAVELRKVGLSVRAVADVTCLPRRVVVRACKGIQPAVELPDLPGLGS